METVFYINTLAFATLTWYTIAKQPTTYNSVTIYISIIVVLISLLLIILYHLYVYIPITSVIYHKMFIGQKLNMLLLSLQAPSSRHQQLRNPPLDDNIHRFDELLDVIAGPANATNYELQPRNTPCMVPIHSSVILNHDNSLLTQENTEEEYTVSQSDSENEWSYGCMPGRGAKNFMANYHKV